MAKTELKAEKRDKFGRVQSVALRAGGFVPAELYGRGVENVHLSVPVKELARAYDIAGENEIVNLTVDGEIKPVIIHAVQLDPISQEFRSVDFFQVNMKEEIELAVPFEFVGAAPAVKDFGGVLITNMDEVEVRCLPGNIPSEIKIDLSVLAELHSSIYVKDLPKSDKYEFLTDESSVIVSIAEQQAEEEIAPEAEITVADVKVEGEEKKAERDAEKAAAESPEAGK